METFGCVVYLTVVSERFSMEIITFVEANN